MTHSYATKRLAFRLVEISDLYAIHKLHSLPEVDEFNTLGIPKDLNESKSVVEGLVEDNNEGLNLTFVVESKSKSEFIGLIALKLSNKKYRSAEVWYKFHSDYWGLGYATESLKGLMDYAFEKLNLHRIEAGCAVGNIASIRILEKVGMIREGGKRKALPLKSGWSDNYEFAILESDRTP